MVRHLGKLYWCFPGGALNVGDDGDGGHVLTLQVRDGAVPVNHDLGPTSCGGL